MGKSTRFLYNIIFLKIGFFVIAFGIYGVWCGVWCGDENIIGFIELI